jgi:hypothetical protein
MFRQGDKNALSLLWHIQHYFDNVFEALKILFILIYFFILMEQKFCYLAIAAIAFGSSP